MVGWIDENFAQASSTRRKPTLISVTLRFLHEKGPSCLITFPSRKKMFATSRNTSGAAASSAAWEGAQLLFYRTATTTVPKLAEGMDLPRPRGSSCQASAGRAGGAFIRTTRQPLGRTRIVSIHSAPSQW